jgi:hypothetical protein
MIQLLLLWMVFIIYCFTKISFGVKYCVKYVKYCVKYVKFVVIFHPRYCRGGKNM